MDIGTKQNKNTFPESPYVLKAEEINQIVDELQSIITLAGIVLDDTDTTQVWQALQILFATFSSTVIIDDNGVNEKTQSERNREYEAALVGGITLAYPAGYVYGGLLTYNSTTAIDIAASKSRSSDNTKNIDVAADTLTITTNANWASGTAPSLVSVFVYIWAVYNSGTPKYLFDDLTGTNIVGEKRLVAKLRTNSSSQILSTTLYSYSNPPTVIDHFQDGNSWYRIWSDGWIEQGGRVSISANTSAVITLLVPYKDTNYYSNANGGISLSSNFADWAWVNGGNPTSTTQITVQNFYDQTRTIQWEAKGY